MGLRCIMSEDRTQKLVEAEKKVSANTWKEHSDELNIMVDLFNTYITGFNIIGSFTLSEDTEVEHAWLRLLIRSYQSMRCALLLVSKGYYGQAIGLLRSITDDWLKCKDCRNYRPTLDALLYDKHRFGDQKLKLRDIDIAIRVREEKVYEQDYRFQSRFTHPSRLSLAITTDPDTNEARTFPVYYEILFLACCELFLRNALRMTEFMEAFLSSIVTTEVDTWRATARKPCAEAADWLKIIHEKYASYSDEVSDA